MRDLDIETVNDALKQRLEADKRSYNKKINALLWLAAAVTLAMIVGGLIIAALLGLFG